MVGWRCPDDSRTTGHITKRRLLESDMAFPKGFKAPICLKTEPCRNQYESLNAAIDVLEEEIDAFEWVVPALPPAHDRSIR